MERADRMLRKGDHRESAGLNRTRMSWSLPRDNFQQANGCSSGHSMPWAFSSLHDITGGNHGDRWRLARADSQRVRQVRVRNEFLPSESEQVV
jgi:hypothetical protein